MNHRYFITFLLSLGLMTGIVNTAHAVKAYPHPITVTQPDGTTLTIQIHGDEFLNWVTVGNRLVAKGEDGFYYYASFNSDGTKSISRTRAKAETLSISQTSTVRPPESALAAARIKRESTAFIGNPDLANGERHFLVMLVEYSDVRFTIDNPQEAFFRLLNEPGYSENGATGSSYDYYYNNSMGQFNPTFDVIGPVTVSGSRQSYGTGQNFGNIHHLWIEACRIADETLDIDFSKYDLDNDGYIDNIFFYYAGHNEAEGGTGIWPHQSVIYSWMQPNTLDGKYINTYACTSEYRGTDHSTVMAGIGTFTHEFGHVIGLPDFYDTDYDYNGYAPAIGSFSLMDVGPYNNNGCTPPYLSGYERALLGWLELEEWTESGIKTLPPVQENTAFITPTANEGEFFVYEYRNGEGYDAYIDSYLDISGVLIYHVDRTSEYISRWNNNQVNAYADHQCYDLIESIYPESSVFSNNDRVFPGRTNNRVFNASSSPAAVDWKNNPTGYNLSDISDNGTNATLTLSIMASGTPIPEFIEAGINCIHKNKETYSNGDTFEFLLSLSNNQPVNIIWYFDGQEQTNDSIVLTSGEHTVEAVLTYSDNSTERITTRLKVQ